jgi:type I restriction enzyme, R subunit
MNNLYAQWCAQNGHPRREPYAFKCTASVGGAQYLADLRGASRSHFIATTVDLLTTGVDVPCERNIVFFKYVRSPIAFSQMLGRGTRLDVATGKLMFRVYDYTDATRLFGEEFVTRWTPKHEPAEVHGGAPIEKPTPEPTVVVEGFEVRITDAGRYIVTQADGKAIPVTVEEDKERLATRLVEEAPTAWRIHKSSGCPKLCMPEVSPPLELWANRRKRCGRRRNGCSQREPGRLLDGGIL